MTTDTERQFFETFDIKRREYTHCCSMGCTKPNADCDNCVYHDVYKSDYPQITDSHYLQLVCWVNERRIFQNFDVNGLKEYVLKELCTMVVTDQFKQQVQALFKDNK